MSAPTDQLAEWLAEQQADYDRNPARKCIPVLIGIVREYQARLTEIARMPCIAALLGEESGDGCASCQAKVALAQAAALIPKGE